MERQMERHVPFFLRSARICERQRHNYLCHDYTWDGAHLIFGVRSLTYTIPIKSKRSEGSFLRIRMKSNRVVTAFFQLAPAMTGAGGYIGWIGYPGVIGITLFFLLSENTHGAVMIRLQVFSLLAPKCHAQPKPTRGAMN